MHGAAPDSKVLLPFFQEVFVRAFRQSPDRLPAGSPLGARHFGHGLRGAGRRHPRTAGPSRRRPGVRQPGGRRAEHGSGHLGRPAGRPGPRFLRGLHATRPCSGRSTPRARSPMVSATGSRPAPAARRSTRAPTSTRGAARRSPRSPTGWSPRSAIPRAVSACTRSSATAIDGVTFSSLYGHMLLGSLQLARRRDRHPRPAGRPGRQHRREHGGAPALRHRRRLGHLRSTRWPGSASTRMCRTHPPASLGG